MGFRGSRVQIPPSRLELAAVRLDPPRVSPRVLSAFLRRIWVTYTEPPRQLTKEAQSRFHPATGQTFGGCRFPQVGRVHQGSGSTARPHRGAIRRGAPSRTARTPDCSKGPFAFGEAMETVRSLPQTWRERAAYLEQFGDPVSARLWKIAAGELERALHHVADETLSLAEAAAASGFTADHLGSLIRRGRIPNAGRPNAPRIRRSDLPSKKAGGPGRPRRPRAVDREHIRRIAHS